MPWTPAAKEVTMRFLAGWIVMNEDRQRRLRQLGASERSARRRPRQ
jgi:hypothetical protein